MNISKNAKVAYTLEMLEEEFHVLSACERMEKTGGEGPGFLYRENWNSSNTEMFPQVSFDGGQTWAYTGISLNTSGMESSNGTYTFDSSNDTASAYFLSLGENASTAFLDAFNYVLNDCEGGFSYTNHPSDPGGSTYAGITLSTYQSYADQFQLPPDIQGLQSMTVDQIATIYQDTWDNVQGDSIMNGGFAQQIFDLSILTGYNAVKELQKTLNDTFGTSLTADGYMGYQTINTINMAIQSNNFKTMVDAYNAKMEQYFTNLNNPTFLQGWLNRLQHYEYDSFYESNGSND